MLLAHGGNHSLGDFPIRPMLIFVYEYLLRARKEKYTMREMAGLYGVSKGRWARTEWWMQLRIDYLKCTSEKYWLVGLNRQDLRLILMAATIRSEIGDL
jgi:hypothetical protein